MDKIFEYIKKYDILILVILGSLLYYPTLFYDFVYDDIPAVINNESLNGIKQINFFQFFIPKFVIEAVYTPITFIVYWLIIKIYGANAFAFHFINIFFYISSSIALLYLLKKIINNYSIAFFAVILYILYPCHIENTVWISAMGYNIATLFFFLSFLYFIIAFDENKGSNYIYSVVFYILAILSQPMAVTLPAILVLWVYCFRRERLKELIKYIFAYIPFLLIYLFLFRNNVSNSYRFSEQISHSFIEKLSVFGKYLVHSIFAFDLNPFYTNISSFYIVFIIPFLCFLFVVIHKKNKILEFLVGFYLISLFPYLGIFFDNVLLLSDRYLLLASVSSCILISMFCFWIFEKLKEKSLLKYMSFFIFIVLYFSLSLAYLPVWNNNSSFWSYSYENSSKKDINISSSYGTILLNNGKFVEASNVGDELIKLSPKNKEGYILKIHSLLALNEIDKAIAVCSKFKEAMPESFESYLYFSDINFKLQNYDKSMEYLKEAHGKALKYASYTAFDNKLFTDRMMRLYYVNSDSNKFIESLEESSRQFKLLNDNGEFSKILKEKKYSDREEICLNYLKRNNSEYSRYILMLLSCLYMKETYKEDAPQVMRELLKEMNKAEEFIKKGDNKSAENIYLSIISKNKYICEAYYNLGFLYLRINRQIEANKIFNKILEINPNDDQIKQILVNLGLNTKHE